MMLMAGGLTVDDDDCDVSVVLCELLKQETKCLYYF